MMSVNVNEHHAYVEVEVFGAYQPERIFEVLEAMRGLAERHGHFSVLEVHHGKVKNMFSMLKKLGSADPEADYSFMTKMRKYALVSDSPGFLMQLMIFLSSFGKIKLRIFKKHERDLARQWIEENAPAKADVSRLS